MRRLLSLSLLAAALVIATGCGDSATLPTEKPKPSEGTSRPRPGESGKIEKGSAVPKGAMKPTAD